MMSVDMTSLKASCCFEQFLELETWWEVKRHNTLNQRCRGREFGGGGS